MPAASDQAVDYFITHVATSGAKQAIGKEAAEHAEPLYEVRSGVLHLAEPPVGTNAHLEVVVLDGADKRFVPELIVHVTLEDDQGNEVGTYHLPFLWHPTMYHYGRSIHPKLRNSVYWLEMLTIETAGGRVWHFESWVYG